MQNITKKINSLPNELEEYIYTYYWSNIFFEVLTELKNIVFLDQQINYFIDRNNNLLKGNNYYYKKYNYLIKKITNNRGKMLLCKYNNLNLKYCNIKYINTICSSINNDYKYIAPFLICKSNFLSYQVFYYLKSL